MWCFSPARNWTFHCQEEEFALGLDPDFRCISVQFMAVCLRNEKLMIYSIFRLGGPKKLESKEQHADRGQTKSRR